MGFGCRQASVFLSGTTTEEDLGQARRRLWNGVMLYELITGERLVQHQQTVQDTVKQILSMDVAARVGSDDRIPADLKPILIKAMALNPADRYSWMEDFIEDIRAVVKRLALVVDIAAFTKYMKDQFQREMLLDRRRMRKLISEERSRADAWLLWQFRGRILLTRTNKTCWKPWWRFLASLWATASLQTNRNFSAQLSMWVQENLSLTKEIQVPMFMSSERAKSGYCENGRGEARPGSRGRRRVLR